VAVDFGSGATTATASFAYLCPFIDIAMQTSAQSPVPAPDPITFTIAYTNVGNIALDALTLTHTFETTPDECFVFDTADPAPTSNDGNGTLTWDAAALGGSLAVGATRTVEVTVLSLNQAGVSTCASEAVIGDLTYQALWTLPENTNYDPVDTNGNWSLLGDIGLAPATDSSGIISSPTAVRELSSSIEQVGLSWQWVAVLTAALGGSLIMAWRVSTAQRVRRKRA
jgi:hypothetical protein